MMEKVKKLGQRFLPLLVLLVIGCLLSVLIPVSGALWREMLGASGEVQIATRTPSPTPTPTPDNCTYTAGYWKNHPQAWPVEEITIGSVTYITTEAIGILQTPPQGDATYILAHQLIAAKLNVLNGTEPGPIATTADEADSWLVAHLLGSDPSDPDREVGIVLATALDAYNNGLNGPDHCEDEPLTPTPTDTPSPTDAPREGTIEPSETPRAQETDEATATSTPEPTGTPTYTQCTYPVEYWKDHPEAWSVGEIPIGGETYDQTAALVILDTAPRGDATYILAHQLIGAKLNILNGTDPTAIVMAVDQADRWLLEHPLGSNPNQPDRQVGTALAEMLEDYNDGLIGPGPCEHEPPTATYTPTPTDTAEPPTPTDTPEPPTPTDTVEPPTLTDTPEPPTPTDTPEPPTPTDTPGP